MRTLRLILFVVSSFMIAATMSGCGDDNPVNSFAPSVSNEVDLFTFQANNAYVVSETLTYSWNNTGAQASVEHLSGRSGGSGTLSIFDADGKLVYTEDLQANETDATDIGNPGVWRVAVDLNEFSGSIYFKLQKL